MCDDLVEELMGSISGPLGIVDPRLAQKTRALVSESLEEAYRRGQAGERPKEWPLDKVGGNA